MCGSGTNGNTSATSHDAHCICSCLRFAGERLFGAENSAAAEKDNLINNDFVALRNDLRRAVSHLVRCVSHQQNLQPDAEALQWRSFIEHMNDFNDKLQHMQVWAAMNRYAHGNKKALQPLRRELQAVLVETLRCYHDECRKIRGEN